MLLCVYRNAFYVDKLDRRLFLLRSVNKMKL